DEVGVALDEGGLGVEAGPGIGIFQRLDFDDVKPVLDVKGKRVEGLVRGGGHGWTSCICTEGENAESAEGNAEGAEIHKALRRPFRAPGSGAWGRVRRWADPGRCPGLGLR